MEEAVATISQPTDREGNDLGDDKEHQNTSQSESKMENWMDGESNENSQTDVDPPSSKNTHPVFGELIILNGQINRLNIEELKSRLRKNHLDTHGKKEVLCKRLKAYVQRQKLQGLEQEDELCPQRNLYYDYYVVIDFEATCDEHQNQQTYRHEIIEFPAQLISTKKARVVGHFHSYVRPLINPRLSTFCTNLTGITQDVVNVAPTFPQVLKQFEEWLDTKRLASPKSRVAVLTDGPWDMGRFLHQQCSISKVPYPSWGKEWINIRKTYSNFYKTKKMCLKDMLNHLGMKFQGQPHSGLDDSRNIARVAIRVLKDGANLRVNERITLRKDGSYNPRERVVHNISRHNFEAKKIKLLSTITKDNSSSLSDNNLNETDSDCDDTKHQESESLWPNTGDDEEFPELKSANRMKKT